MVKFLSECLIANVVKMFTIKKRNLGILFPYRPPNNNNLKLFFDKTAKSANQLLFKI